MQHPIERDLKALLFAGRTSCRTAATTSLRAPAPYNGTTSGSQPSRHLAARRSGAAPTCCKPPCFGSLRNPEGAGDDVVYGRTRAIEEQPKLLSRVDVLRGRTGEQVWGLGPEL